MQINQIPLSAPLIKGDPATRRFGLFLIGALAMISFGSIAGIVAGNIAHYAYFPSSNATNITNTSVIIFWNQTIVQGHLPTKSLRLWLSPNERVESPSTSRKTRDTWSMIDKPANNRRW